MNPNLPVTEWRVLWFAPNAGLWEPAQLEHDLANGLVASGARVTVVRCRGLFDSFCPVMHANNLDIYSRSSQKETLCRDCRQASQAFDSVATYTSIWLDDYVSEDSRKIIRDQVASVSQANYEERANQDSPLYINSAYLSMLHHKVPEVTATDVSWNEYKSDLGNSLFALEAFPSIFNEVDPTHCFVYNPLYPTNRVFTELALKYPSIQFVGVTASGFVANRYLTIALYPSMKASQTAVDSQTLLSALEVPMTALEVDLVARHIGHLVQGSDPWVYSTPPTLMSASEIRRQLNISQVKPVAVVLVGSPDETRSSALVGAEFERVPIDQVSTVHEFMESTLHAATHLPEIEFVFRLHPRLAPNKRESLRSPDLDSIEQLLKDRPANVVINTPGDGLGLYDVARVAAIGINHASSAGLEFLALGIPVVHYDPPRLNAYPPSLGVEVQRGNGVQFVSEIRKATTGERSMKRAVLAWRWYAVTLVRAITHKTWDSPPESPSLAVPPSFPRLRGLIPKSIRASIARRLALRSRAQRIAAADAVQIIEPWVEECVERISRFENSTIWNPLVITRGEPLTPSEELELVTSRITQMDPQGQSTIDYESL